LVGAKAGRKRPEGRGVRAELRGMARGKGDATPHGEAKSAEPADSKGFARFEWRKGVRKDKNLKGLNGMGRARVFAEMAGRAAERGMR